MVTEFEKKDTKRTEQHRAKTRESERQGKRMKGGPKGGNSKKMTNRRADELVERNLGKKEKGKWTKPKGKRGVKKKKMESRGVPNYKKSRGARVIVYEKRGRKRNPIIPKRQKGKRKNKGRDISNTKKEGGREGGGKERKRQLSVGKLKGGPHQGALKVKTVFPMVGKAGGWRHDDVEKRMQGGDGGTSFRIWQKNQRQNGERRG